MTPDLNRAFDMIMDGFAELDRERKARCFDMNELHKVAVSNMKPEQLATYAKAKKMGWTLTDYVTGGNAFLVMKDKKLIIATDGTYKRS